MLGSVLAWEELFPGHPYLYLAFDGDIFLELLWVVLWTISLFQLPSCLFSFVEEKPEKRREDGDGKDIGSDQLPPPLHMYTHPP